MADDTRQERMVQAHEIQGDKPFAGRQWEEVAPAPKPPPNANLMAGGTEHTAGGKLKDVPIAEAAKSIKLEDWTMFHRKPCVRDSLLTGIGGGFAAGALRGIWKAPVWTACSWAVGTFCFGSFSMYQYCNYQRQAEKEGMKRAMEIMDRKQVERKQKEARMERARELRRQKKEEELDQQFAKLHEKAENKSSSAGEKPWYKVW